jgi:hypothetical protein
MHTISKKCSACLLVIACAAVLQAGPAALPQSFEWTTALPAGQGMSSTALDNLRQRLAAANTKALLVPRRTANGETAAYHAFGHFDSLKVIGAPAGFCRYYGREFPDTE